MIVIPCKDCEDRHVACHSTCERYIKWKEESDKIKKEIDRNRHVANDIYSVRRATISRIYKKLNK